MKQFKNLFPVRKIMSLGRRSLSCPREQLKPFFSPREQLCPQGEGVEVALRSNLSFFFSPNKQSYPLGEMFKCPMGAT
jgi:hypothetical protein